jgi:glyoxylase-like metal-dependent hydrolase (beta-lactamase superfamily II)
VVATHLHWDHCYNNELFPQAAFLVQRTELQFAAAPYPIFANAYEAPTTGMTPAYSKTKFEVLDGDLDLADGLKIVYAPGHTPGMQCLLVNTSDGVYYIAGDNVALYKNLEGNRFGRPIPGVNYVDLGEYYASLRAMLRVCRPYTAGVTTSGCWIGRSTRRARGLPWRLTATRQSGSI